MTKQEATLFAKDMYQAFNTMDRNSWRSHVRNEAQKKGEDEGWVLTATMWLEQMFSMYRK
jgi:hypothetical protein